MSTKQKKPRRSIISKLVILGLLATLVYIVATSKSTIIVENIQEVREGGVDVMLKKYPDMKRIVEIEYQKREKVQEIENLETKVEELNKQIGELRAQQEVYHSQQDVLANDIIVLENEMLGFTRGTTPESN